MEKLVNGIHHVTAFASDAQTNVDFYVGILGLRLVKRTVNFEASSVYHLYYGDDTGTPGSIITFFPYKGMARGRHGKGFVTTTTFSVPYASLDFWLERLKRFNVNHKPPQERFQQEVVVYLEDRDGLGVELVFNTTDKRVGHTSGTVPTEHAIKGFHNVEIWHDGYEKTGAVLTQLLDHNLIGESGNRFRFGASNLPGDFVDIIATPENSVGRAGVGTVHHIAFKTADRVSIELVRKKVEAQSLSPTEVKDRKYFQSIYFREPAGVLFEVATSDVGFGIDETAASLGSSLMLPSWFEADRAVIESQLSPITVDLKKFR